MHRRSMAFQLFLFFSFILLCCLAQKDSPSIVGQNGAIVDPMMEPWHNKENGLSSGWLLKLRRRREEGGNAKEQIQKCIQENSTPTEGAKSTPAAADPNDDPESGYGKCDVAMDCCNLVNEDKKQNEKVECDCAKLIPK